MHRTQAIGVLHLPMMRVISDASALLAADLNDPTS